MKLGFSRATGQPTSENEDDLTRYTTEIGIIVRQFSPHQVKKWDNVPSDAKDRLIAHVRVSSYNISFLIYKIKLYKYFSWIYAAIYFYILY